MPYALIFLWFVPLAVLAMLSVQRLVVAMAAWRSGLFGGTSSSDAGVEGAVADAYPAECLPTVLVQIPLYNEATVARRVIDAVCGLDYPRELLSIQVLDDSTDSTRAHAKAAVHAWRRIGVDIVYLRRNNRAGFKAGALAAGLRRSSAEFVAVFDADFIPQPQFLRLMLPSFGAGPAIGMVQARWGHLNRTQSWLTQAQSVLLDGHFVNEHGGRFARGCFFNFNGTAGIWRRRCIDEAGGWLARTLTEDLDLSYRAQLLGWRFVYRPDVVVPAELPETAEAFKAQQHRWAKGAMETARFVLPSVWQARQLPWTCRLEASCHLLANLAYPVVLALVLAMPLIPTMQTRAVAAVGSPWLLWTVHAGLWLATMGTHFVCYGGAQWWLGQRQGLWWRLPLALAVGMGLSVNNTWAVIQSIAKKRTPFARTPKRGDSEVIPLGGRGPMWQRGTEVAIACWLLLALGMAVWRGWWGLMPMLALASGGLLAVAGLFTQAVGHNGTCFTMAPRGGLQCRPGNRRHLATGTNASHLG